VRRFAISLFMLAILLLSASPARAENPTEASFGCAPWDGPTLEISISAPDVVIQARIWAKGYDDLVKGTRDIAINNKALSPGVSDATGEAWIRDARNPSPTSNSSAGPGAGVGLPTAMLFHFDTVEMKADGALKGYVEVADGTKYPFGGTITAQHMPCG
jgi:hypothetical protein